MLGKSAARATVVLVVALALVPSRPRAAAPDGPRWGKDYFPNIALTTQDGQTVHLYDDLLKDKTVAINLIYTSCQYQCPLETARLAQVQRMLGDRVGRDIFFYSITLDPEHDTPSVLKAYADKYHAGPGWLFLTGATSDIELASKKLGLYSDPAANKDGHAAILLIGNVASGQWVRNAATDNPRFLALMIGEFLSSWRNRRASPATSYADAPALSIDKGQYLFATRCAACHTIGRGDVIGPDLRGVTLVRGEAWLARFIKTPDEMLTARDPIAISLLAKYKQVPMPNLRLGDGDVSLVIAYLKSQAVAAR